MLLEEQEALEHISSLQIEALNLDAIAVVTNIYRIAQGLRYRLERQVLSKYDLSWTAFSILYDIWLHDAMETKELAKSAGVTKATVSNITNTLEKKNLCFRKSDPRDRRITYVQITEAGKKIMEELYPDFHNGEAEIAGSLTTKEQQEMSRMLRKMINGNQF